MIIKTHMVSRKILGRIGASLVASAVAAALGSPAAIAADAEAAKGDSLGLEEVVVSARKREERLQDVPVAITAFDASGLERNQISSLQDMRLAVPNMVITRTQGSQNGASLYMRGMGNDNSSIEEEPTVGLYVDGVYMGQNIGALVDLVDVAQLEVLRGPQGTLYGRNTMSGAIRIDSKRPRTDVTTAKAELTVGSFNRVDIKASANIPLSDKVGFNISGISRTDDGWYTHATTDQKLNKKNTQGLRAGLNWEISDTMNLFIAADFSRDRSGLYVATPMTNTNPVTTRPTYGLYISAPDMEDRNRFIGWGISANLDWTTGIGKFTSITASRTMDFVQSYDLSDTPGGLKLDRDPFHQIQFSQEIQYASNWSGPLSLSGGVYYSRERAHEVLGFIVAPGVELPFGADQTSRSTAVYGELTYAITDALKVSAGGRQTWDNKRIERQGIFAPITDSQSYSEFTPRALISYQLNPDALFYGSVSKGYSAGKYQAFPSDNATAAFILPPQHVKAFEVGAKTQWLDRRLTANIALFRNDYTDLGLNIGGSGSLLRALSADLRAQGGELELAARVTKDLTVTAQVARLKTEFTRTPTFPGGPNVGDPQRYSPPWSVGLGADYVVPVSATRSLTFGGKYSWADDTMTTNFNDPWFIQKAYSLFDARIALEDSEKNWSVEIGGRNLGNTTWFDQASVLSGPIRYYQPPRTWAISFKLSM